MIQVQDLQYKLSGKSILEDINLEIPDGVFAAIIGPNGAGKSTLIKLIMGLLEIQEGSISIDGVPQDKWLKKHGFGYLPQREEYDRSFPATALDITLMGIAGTLGWGKRCGKEHKQKALDAMRQCGIETKASARIGSLSGGEFQRVMLSRAILGNSKYLILVEPEAGIDRNGVSSFFELLKKLNDAGKTVITISHDLHTLSEYCNYLICLNRRLHCHNHSELVNADIIHKTFGDTVRLIEKDY